MYMYMYVYICILDIYYRLMLFLCDIASLFNYFFLNSSDTNNVYGNGFVIYGERKQVK